MEATLTGRIDQLRYYVPLSGTSCGGDLEIHQQAMPIFHQRLTHVTEASLLPRTLAVQPSVGIGRALVGRIRSFLTMEVDPAIARAATVRALGWRRFIFGPKALEARSGFDQRAVHAEVLVTEQVQ